MSATNRKKKDGTRTERKESDYYPTPAWVIHRLLSQVQLPGGYWLEPGAGDGSIIRAVNSIRGDIEWTAIELRQEQADWLGRCVGQRGYVMTGDFLFWTEWPLETGFNVAIGNPPFSLAAQFVDRALEVSDNVVMLLRLNFLGSSRKRRELFECRGVPDVYVLPERPSFTGRGTDACEYAWMRWMRDGSQRGEVKILWDKFAEVAA